MNRILINREELETRVALVKEERLEDFFIERTDRDRLSGSIYNAKVRNLEASLQAAFVDIGERKNAFVHYWDMLPATWDMIEVEEAPSKKKKNNRRQRRKPREDKRNEEKDKTQKTEEKEVPKGLLARLKSKLFTETATPTPETKQKNQNGGKQRQQQRQQQRREEPEEAEIQPQRPKKKKNPYKAEDIPELYPENSNILVQVNKGPMGNKGARVTTNLSIPGRYLVLMPRSSHVGVSKRVDDREERKRLRKILGTLEIPPGMGLICRTAGMGRSEKQFHQDFEMLLGIWEEIQEKCKKKSERGTCVYRDPDLAERILRDCLTEDIDEIVTDSEEVYEMAVEQIKRLSREEHVNVKLYKKARPLFQQHNISQQIDSLFRRRVNLPGGGYLVFDETEALIAIDVNTGRNRSAENHDETILTTNLEAVQEVARQLKMRNIGGLVIIDFIDMRSKQDQQAVQKAFRQEMGKDRARTRISPISQFGLVEMTRQRDEESVHNRVYIDCPYCKGRGRVKSSTSMSVEIQRRLQWILQRRRGKIQVRVSVHPDILERLRNEDAELLARMEEEFGGELSFRADPELHIEEFKLIDQENGKEI